MATATPPVPRTSTVKDRVGATIEQHSKMFVDLAHDIYQHPELAFAETFASSRITALLSQHGFNVREGVGQLPTAFTATIGNGPLHIAFCAEYDALDEGIGHGCGHNLIAGAAVAAGVGLAGVTDEIGLTVSVIGTPGEELLGLKDPPPGHFVSGKIALLDGGVYDDVHAVLMVHPGPSPYWEFTPAKATLRLRAQFAKATRGADVDATTALRLDRALRRVLARRELSLYFCRVAPDGQDIGARVDLSVAGESLADVTNAAPPLRECLRKAASAAGVTVAITEYTPNAELHQDPRLADAFRVNAEALGRVREIQPSIRASCAT